MMILALLSVAHAATLTVQPGGGGGSYPTIQRAIQAASSGDIIQIQAGAYTGPVDTSGKNITLAGAGSSVVTVSGAPDEVLNVDQGETVVVSGLTLQSSGQGAEVRASSATFSDVNFTNNTGVVSGGGIGVFSGSNVSLTDCEVSNNRVTGSFNGGGMHISDSTLILDNVSIDSNTASQGGGVYATGSTLQFTDVSISNNDALSHGGGVRIRDSSELTATRASIEDNTAVGRGGGVSAEASDTSWVASTVLGNQTGSAGGGLHLSGVLTAGTTFDGTISSNRSAGDGGGVYLNGHDLQLSGVLSANVPHASADGAGLYGLASSVSVSGLTVNQHAATTGGALFLSSSSALTVAASSFDDNESVADGGAIYVEGSLAVVDSDFTNNRAGGGGGAIWAQAAPTTLTRTQFANNSAGTLEAGGAVAIRQGNLTATTVTFENNTGGYGAGLALIGSGSEQHDIRSSGFSSNIANADGGGLYLTSASSVLIAAVSFTRNIASASGGGASLSDPGLTYLRHSDWLFNEALVGGGLSVSGITSGQSAHNDFGGNTATTAGGARYSLPAGLHPITNSRFYDNSGDGIEISGGAGGSHPVRHVDSAGNLGSGVRFRNVPTSELSASIVAFNAASGVVADATSSAGLLLQWSNSYDNAVGWGGALGDRTGTDGNLSVEPQYLSYTPDGDPTGDTFELASGSPCRDAGDPTTTDPDGSRADMGSHGGPGALNVDGDRDGYTTGDGDCDDTDPTTFPDAADTWYDGIDSDCAGDDDWDADRDGYRSELHPSGDDCDDTAPSVHPAAADDTVDGVDQDCDGYDGESTDQDQPSDTGETSQPDPEDTDLDGDGVSAPADCNDAEPRAHPGRRERCGDGIDNDCDGFVDDLDAECIPDQSSGCAHTQRSGSHRRLAWAGLVSALLLCARRREGTRRSSAQ